jgi:hypothetical protein
VSWAPQASALRLVVQRLDGRCSACRPSDSGEPAPRVGFPSAHRRPEQGRVSNVAFRGGLSPIPVDVDHEPAASFGPVSEQFRRDRLARPQRSGQQLDGGRPAREASVISNFTGRAPPVTVRPVHATVGARLVRADRRQRAELLDREDIGVVTDGARRPRAAGDRKNNAAAARAAVAARRCHTGGGAPRYDARARLACRRRPPARLRC